MRPTPEEIVKEKDDNLIVKWIEEASPEELREFRLQDLGNVSIRVNNALVAKMFKEIGKMRSKWWFISRAILAIGVVVLIAVVYRNIFKH
jgi:hypothetical protein